MNSIYEKHKTLVVCVILAALIVAVGAVASVLLESQSASVNPAGTAAAVEEEPSKPVKITVKADGNTLDFLAAETTVKEVLESHNINVGKHDVITPGLKTAVKDGMEISIQRVEFKKETVKEDVPYKIEEKGVDTLPQGTSRVVIKGKNGKDKVTYRVKFVEGEEVSREELSREVIEAPVTEVVEKSTVGTIEGKEYSRKFTVKAYSYTGGGRTASGKPAAVGRIAVDPRVIPLGTKVYVEGYGFCEAADTGGNIKGNTIDVYFNSAGQCRQWGVRNVTIYILK